ncbi:hypothetical protein RCH14_000732 [Massilia sp. MP_M2]|uniref:hypothetical protein n=1 Tax=Massilia sp. MP_M2 TaxID=3071713 RepID=UPI00319E7036
MANNDSKSDELSASIQSVAPLDARLQVVVRLQNKAARALHYVADVRATRYDPATRTLTLALSDEGREVIPGLAGRLPLFRHVDPGSEAEIHLSVPDKIVKLSRSAGSVESGELAFETQQLSDVREVVVEVAWADVPYYHDTRASSLQDARLPAARWEQHKARATKRQDKKRPPKA